MSQSWMDAIGTYESEPDYDAYIAELESLESIRANVGSYDDWFMGED